MRKGLWFITILSMTMIWFSACNTSNVNNQDNQLLTDNSLKLKLKLKAYGGSDPKGDYILFEVDPGAQQVRYINFSTGTTNGWYDYSPLMASDPLANGFSIIQKATLLSNAYQSLFVLFAEFPKAACIYQLFQVSNGLTNTVGNPVYIVYQDQLQKNHLYGRAYNWLKFRAGSNPTLSDIETGFAAFDNSSKNGKMYGVKYNPRNKKGDDATNCGVDSIDQKDAMGLDSLVQNTSAGALTHWLGADGDWTRSVSLTGSPTGPIVVDFGTNNGGGSGLAIPQTTAVSNISDWWATVSGVYVSFAYEYDSKNNLVSIRPMKVQISTSGMVKLMEYTDHVKGPSVFSHYVSMMATDDTSSSPKSDMTIKDLLKQNAKNDLADSEGVKNANLCLGSFIYSAGNTVFNIVFDPAGQYLGYTMYEDKGSKKYTIRFGLGIKDSGYNDNSF